MLDVDNIGLFFVTDLANEYILIGLDYCTKWPKVIFKSRNINSGESFGRKYVYKIWGTPWPSY